MERITIDVTRNRGSRSANIRIHVGPTPGEQGSSFVFATVSLRPETRLTAELATHIAHSVEQSLILSQRGDLLPAWEDVPLPF